MPGNKTQASLLFGVCMRYQESSPDRVTSAAAVNQIRMCQHSSLVLPAAGRSNWRHDGVGGSPSSPNSSETS